MSCKDNQAAINVSLIVVLLINMTLSISGTQRTLLWEGDMRWPWVYLTPIGYPSNYQPSATEIKIEDSNKARRICHALYSKLISKDTMFLACFVQYPL